MKLLHLLLFAVSTNLSLAEENKPNRDDPATLKRILSEAIESHKLEERDKGGEGLLYASDSQIPYTGWAKGMYKNGQAENIEHYTDGKLNGLGIWWYENGRKYSETNYKNGKKHGIESMWHEPALDYDAGEVAISKVNYKNGEKHGIQTWWDKEGNIIRQSRFDNGRKVEAIK